MRYANMLFSEILHEFDKANGRAARIAVLREYGSNPWFREFLNYTFNPRIQFDIGEIPTYKPAVEPAGLNFATLSNEMRRLYIFIVGHPKRTAKLDAKHEARILNVLLGSLHKDEAALLVKMFSKKLEIKYLTAPLVKEAFPKMPFEVAEPVVAVEAPVKVAVKVAKTQGATVKV